MNFVLSHQKLQGFFFEIEVSAMSTLIKKNENYLFLHIRYSGHQEGRSLCIMDCRKLAQLNGHEFSGHETGVQ